MVLGRALRGIGLEHTPLTIRVPTRVIKPLRLSERWEETTRVEPCSVGASRDDTSSRPALRSLSVSCKAARSHSSSLAYVYLLPLRPLIVVLQVYGQDEWTRTEQTIPVTWSPRQPVAEQESAARWRLPLRELGLRRAVRKRATGTEVVGRRSRGWCTTGSSNDISRFPDLHGLADRDEFDEISTVYGGRWRGELGS